MSSGSEGLGTQQQQVKELSVKFVTKRYPKRAPDTPFILQDTLKPKDLNSVLNNLLFDEDDLAAAQDERTDQGVVDNFSFMIDGVFVRSSLNKHIAKYGLSYENVIEVEYDVAESAPEEGPSAQLDDWIGAVSEISSPGQFYVSGSYDGKVRLWNPRDLGSGEPALVVDAFDTAVKCLAAVGKDRLLVGGKDVNVRLVKFTREGAELRSSSVASYAGHTNAVGCLAVSKDQQRFVSASWDKSIRLWVLDDSFFAEDSDEEEVLEQILPGTSKSDSKHKLKKRKVSPEIATRRTELRSFVGHSDCVSSVRWPYDSAFFSGSHDHTVRMWDASTGDIISTWNSGKAVHDVDYSIEHTTVASAHTDKFIRLWDARSKDGNVCRLVLGPHADRPVAVRWLSKRSHQLASACFDGKVYIWDVRSRKPMYTLPAHSTKCLALAEVDGGDTLLSGGGDNKLKIFHLGDQKSADRMLDQS